MASQQEITDFLLSDFPQCSGEVLEVGNKSARVRQQIGHAALRPGGTVSGPTLMTVADLALYVALLGEVGLIPLAVTTQLSINFLRKPSPESAIIGECKLLKTGRQLVVGEVWLYSEGQPDPVAHAVGTYALPVKQLG